jgi:hypothetical protein
VRGPSRRARSAQQHINIAQPVRVALARNHRTEWLADGLVSRMSPRAEAQAGSAPHGLLRALDHRADLRTARYLRERVEGRPYALKRISHGLPDFPADLGQGVGQLGVLVIAHGRILPLAQIQSQGASADPPGRSRPTIILDGVRSGAWWILVGEDAKMIDAAVRAKPEAAYDYAELFSAPAEEP